jgi:hypothetical protein
MYTSAAILLDLARLFLDLMMTVQVSGNVVVSVPLPVVELLEFGTCSHLVKLFLNVVKRLMVDTDLGDVVLELVVDLKLEGPRVGGKFGLGAQLRLGSLLNLGLHVSFHVSVVLDNLENGPTC